MSAVPGAWVLGVDAAEEISSSGDDDPPLGHGTKDNDDNGADDVAFSTLGAEDEWGLGVAKEAIDGDNVPGDSGVSVDFIDASPSPDDEDVTTAAPGGAELRRIGALTRLQFALVFVICSVLLLLCLCFVVVRLRWCYKRVRKGKKNDDDEGGGGGCKKLEDVEEAKQELLAAESLVDGESLSATSSQIDNKLLLSQHCDTIETIQEEEDAESREPTPPPASQSIAVDKAASSAIVIVEEDERDGEKPMTTMESRERGGDVVATERTSPLIPIMNHGPILAPKIAHREDMQRLSNGTVTVEINETKEKSHHTTMESEVINVTSTDLIHRESHNRDAHHRQQMMGEMTTTTTTTSQQRSPVLKDKNLTQIYNMHTHGFTQSDDSLTNAMQQNYAYGNQKEYTGYAAATANQDLLQFYSCDDAAPSPPILPPKKSTQKSVEPTETFRSMEKEEEEEREEEEVKEERKEEEEEEEKELVGDTVQSIAPAAVRAEELAMQDAHARELDEMPNLSENPTATNVEDSSEQISHSKDTDGNVIPVTVQVEEPEGRSDQERETMEDARLDTEENKLSDIQIMVQEASFQATSDSEDDENLKRLSLQLDNGDAVVMPMVASVDDVLIKESNECTMNMNEYDTQVGTVRDQVQDHHFDNVDQNEYGNEEESLQGAEPEEDRVEDVSRDMMAETMRVISEVHEVMHRHDVQPSTGESDEDDVVNQGDSVANNWLPMQQTNQEDCMDLQPMQQIGREREDPYEEPEINYASAMVPTFEGPENIADDSCQVEDDQVSRNNEDEQYYCEDDSQQNNRVNEYEELSIEKDSAPRLQNSIHEEDDGDDNEPEYPNATDHPNNVDHGNGLLPLQGFNNELYHIDPQSHEDNDYSGNTIEAIGDIGLHQELLDYENPMFGENSITHQDDSQQGHSGLPTPPPDSPSLLLLEGQHDMHQAPQWMASPSKISTQSETENETVYPPVPSVSNEYQLPMSHENGGEIEVDEFL